MSRTPMAAGLLVLITVAVYLPVVGFNFVSYDDPVYITDNPMVNRGISARGIMAAFTSFQAGNWHPLTWLSHMVDCQLFRGFAGGHHMVNVLFHAANVGLLFVWLQRLTGQAGWAAFMAAIFGWHPLHVESVAWISERKDVLSTFFGLLALLAYTRYAQGGGKRGDLVLALVCFGLGLLAKPMLVTLPCLFLLLDFWPFQRLKGAVSWRVCLREKWPFFALTAGSCVVTFLAQKHGEAVSSLESVSLGMRWENAITGVVWYMGKLFWPSHLCVLYPLADIPPGEAIGCAVIILAVSGLAWHWRRERPYFLVGWLWFLGTLIPVSGLVQVGAQAVADRYAYIPSVGFFLMVTPLAAEWIGRLAVPRAVVTGGAIMIGAGCIMATEYQLQYWRDSETLFRRAVALTQNNVIAMVNLAAAWDVEGRFDESLPMYKAAERLNPNRYDVHNNLGNILDKFGSYEASLTEYREASRLRPEDPALHDDIGLELGKLGKLGEATGEFEAANRLDAHFVPAHLHYARVLFAMGRDTDALNELHEAIRWDGDNYQTLAVVAHYLATNAHSQARNGPLAVQLASRANDLSGRQQPVVLDILGMALAETGDFTNAQFCAQNAIEAGTALGMQQVGMFQLHLEQYRKNEPWRETYVATNTVGR